MRSATVIITDWDDTNNLIERIRHLLKKKFKFCKGEPALESIIPAIVKCKKGDRSLAFFGRKRQVFFSLISLLKYDPRYNRCPRNHDEHLVSIIPIYNICKISVFYISLFLLVFLFRYQFFKKINDHNKYKHDTKIRNLLFYKRIFKKRVKKR